MANKIPVVAAIPNYNMAGGLERLLPQVLAQSYDHVYVLDNASTDNSRQIAMNFGSRVTCVAGEQNICSAGNRNRIMDQLKTNTLIHFLDADVELISANNPEKIRKIMSQPNVGFAGALVKNSDGKQILWNYGPRQCLHTYISARIHNYMESRPGRNPNFQNLIRRTFNSWLADWPNPGKTPNSQKTYWVNECNLIIESSKFQQLGGFDEQVHSHDIQDLAIRSQKAGYVTLFEPTISVVNHNNKNVRSGNRKKARRRAESYIARKNGLGQWLMPDGHFKPRHN
ncbi:MAG: glycosyltransferase family 2 protein [Candidatus Saccharimonadales bacterium]